jgi:hypothetical protein
VSRPRPLQCCQSPGALSACNTPAFELQQLKKQKDKREQWKRQGHGEYAELQTEKEFFESMKGEESMVCHFYRNNWPCKVMDKHLGTLTKQHLECKFAKVRPHRFCCAMRAASVAILTAEDSFRRSTQKRARI